MTNTAGVEYLALRPLLSDYVMSMPRGAAVVYPKDAGQIVTMADIFPGARVVEAGVGSGALSMSLLRAVGEQRPAASRSSAARTSPTSPAATSEPSSAATTRPGRSPSATSSRRSRAPSTPGTVDRVVLDMLAPWECLDAVADALAPGRRAHLLRRHRDPAVPRGRGACATHGGFTEPSAWESLVRGWHLEGLAVRPQHRMHGHTGFLITTRRLAPGVTPRCASAARPRARTARPGSDERRTPRTWRAGAVRRASPTAEALGERSPSDDRTDPRVRRSVTANLRDADAGLGDVPCRRRRRSRSPRSIATDVRAASHDGAAPRPSQSSDEPGTAEARALRREIAALRAARPPSPGADARPREQRSAAAVGLSTLSSQNERLVRTLKEAREQIVSLKYEVDRLAPAAGGLRRDPRRLRRRHGRHPHRRPQDARRRRARRRPAGAGARPRGHAQRGAQRGEPCTATSGSARSSSSRSCSTTTGSLVVAHGDEERVVPHRPSRCSTARCGSVTR